LDLPTPAIDFWDTFQEALSADFSTHHNENEAICLTLEDISHYLCSQGAGLTQYGLPEPARVEHEINMELDVFVNA
jgi:hypothetical protein